MSRKASFAGHIPAAGNGTASIGREARSAPSRKESWPGKQVREHLFAISRVTIDKTSGKWGRAGPNNAFAK